MRRLTTPTLSAAHVTVRARWAIGFALGILHPSAVPLRDGRVRLGRRDDILAADAVRALEELLAQRAADRIGDDRLLAESVAVLGAEVARARGQVPARGATEAIDRYLRAPGLADSRRTEGEAMLRVALRSAAANDPEAAARLRSMTEPATTPTPSAIVSASSAINRDARLLGVSAPPATRRRGRHRAQVGGRHRSAGDRQVRTSQVRGTGLLTGTRPDSQPALTETHALGVLAAMNRADLAAAVTDQPVVDLGAQQVVLQTAATDVPQHVRVEVGNTTRGALAQGTIRSGTAHEPHILRISSGLADEQLRHVWAHQLTLMTQEIAAARAERPRGVLGRLRSAFGHERRDRRLQADHAAFQVLLRDWHEARAEMLATGRPSGARSIENLQRDLEGLARTIKRHGGGEPALPWTAAARADPDAAAFGIAAARAETAARPARGTPAHLRAQVVSQIADLEQTVTRFEADSMTKRDSAQEAADEAGAKEREAEAEEQQRDLGAAERARVLGAAAVSAHNKARRHTEIADGYEQAAGAAQRALDGYRNLLAEIDAGASPTRLAELAGTAERQTLAYRRSAHRSVPSPAWLMTGQPEGPRLSLPVEQIDRILAQEGVDAQLPTRGPGPLAAAEYRRLMSKDGMLITLSTPPDADVDELPQVRLVMVADDVQELRTPGYKMVEQMDGTLGEGGTSVGTTNTHATNVNVGVNLGPLLALAAPGTPLHAAAQLVSPKVEVSRGRSLAETSGATAHHQSGWVDDNRGESLLYEWAGKLQVEVRKSPTEPWSPVATIDAGRQRTWVSSAYTVKAPTDTVSLDDLGHGDQVTGEFPRHAVTSISGLQDVTDRLVRRAQQEYGDLDRASYNHIAGLMVNDSHRLLREMSQPGGITRQIPSRGETAYELTWEIEPVWGQAELVGESSAEMWQEEVLVDFAGVNAGQTFGASMTGTASAGFPGTLDKAHPLGAATALNSVAGTGVNVSPSVSAGRNVSRSGGQSVSVTSITPAVNRNQGPTQGVLVGLNVRATLRKVGDPAAAPIVENGKAEALLRVAENDLLRVGGRADKDAVRRNPDGSLRTDATGRVLLRGDAEPSAVPQTLPPSMGLGENQLRGVGRGMTQNLQGAEETRDQALEQLAEMGLVARPGEQATPEQRRNRQRVVQQISAPRMEAGIDQACQGGLIVMLEERGPLGVPHWRPFRLSATQEHDPDTLAFTAEGLGVSTNENIVRLGISSRATGRSSGRSKSLPLSAGVGGSHSPGEGVAGTSARAGVKATRNALGKNSSWTAGRRVNRVTLNESTEPLDRFKQKLRITFAEITDRGDAPPIADVQGSMEVAYDTSLARAAAPVFEKNPKPPHRAAVQQAIPVAVDAGNAADTLCEAIPAIRADSTALPALHEALAPNSLVANREWMNGSYRLPFVVVQAPGNPLHALTDGTLLPQEYQIVVRGEAVSLTHLAMSQQNTVDINFTMSDVGSTSGTSVSGGVSGNAGGSAVEADGSGPSGGLSLGRTGGRSQSTSTSETSGDERLLVNPGTHHEFLERYKMTADIVHNGEVVRSISLPDALAQKSMAERRALELYATRKLDLPLSMVTDVAERYLNDKVQISHKVAAGVLTRYQQEKAGVTTGLAAEHTPERLAAKLQQRTRVPASHASSAEERLRKTTERAAAQAAQRQVVHTSEVYQESLGASQLESITVEGKEDVQVDLRKLVEPQVDELAPGLRNASRLLQNALDVDLSPDSYQGHLEDMLGADGLELPIEVPIQGQERPDVLLVRVRARYEGERTMDGVPEKEDGTPDIPQEDAGGIGQNYDYESIDRSTGRTVTVSGGINGTTGTALDADASGGVSTDQTQAKGAGEATTNTGIDRWGHFDKVRTHQTVVFTTEVVRLRNAGAAAMASARWKLGRIDPADVTSVSAPREVRADLIQWIPRGDRLDSPLEQQPGLEERSEHRRIELPEGAVPLRVALYGKDDEQQNQLLANLTEYLEQPGVLGENGAAQYRDLLRTNLKATALKAKAGRLLGEGIDLQPMARPGNGSTRVNVRVNATAVGWELHGPEVEGQEGRVWRRQETYRSSSSSNRLTPLTASGGLDGGFVSASGSIGEQVKEQSSDANGTRLEGSRFLEGQMVTVRIPLVYDATVRTTTDKGRGEPGTRTTTHVPNLARGEMYVRMLGHRYLEVLRQMENGASLDAALAEARLQAKPVDFGPPDITATEYGQGKSGAVYQPYRPLVDALAQARAERRTVVLLVQQADGREAKYQAHANGTLVGQGDGGFASAFATLHQNLALMAESKGIDLRELYNTSSPDGSFSAKVAGELEKAGVPRDVLKALDYTTAARAATPPSGQGSRNSAARSAGRTISPTGQGPSIGGP